MCGIAGILLTPDKADPQRLAPVRAMTAALHHRGPDGDGFWLDGAAGIALGHRRLAIVDLTEAGRQPMVSHGGGFVMTFNGEVYNFAELRAELEALGHRFRGHSDTEVMLAAFENFGIEASLQRFAGMFALALWDRRRRVLHLARDRLGKKPLYIALADGALLFASELKALPIFPGFQPRIDSDAVAAVLRQGWVPDQHCIWQGVFKLAPGSVLSVRADELESGAASLRERSRRWWSLAAVAEQGQQQPLDLPLPELEDELDRVLRLAVRQRMVADVPLGAFLSGGIDSTTVVALMQAQSARPVRTFTIGYRERQFDEAAEASRVARHLGADHTEFRLSAAEACAVIPELPRIWDEPFADESQIPTLLVSRLARRHVTVALTGDGGDESFGGYARHFAAVRLARMLGLPLAVRRTAAGLLSLGSGAGERLLRALPLSGLVRRGLNAGKLARVLDAADEGELYRRLTSLGSSPLTVARPASGGDAAPPLPDLAARLMYRDMAAYLPGDILVKLDRASMAVSLEGRCPLLDHRVVEFAWRLPGSVKIRDGTGKWLLRRVLRRYLPDTLFERPKHGFDVPIGDWLKGPLRDWAEALLARPMLCSEGFVDFRQIKTCWQEHLRGRSDRAYQLWAILMIEAWFAAAGGPAPRASAIEPASGLFDAAAAPAQ